MHAKNVSRQIRKGVGSGSGNSLNTEDMTTRRTINGWLAENIEYWKSSDILPTSQVSQMHGRNLLLILFTWSGIE